MLLALVSGSCSAFSEGAEGADAGVTSPEAAAAGDAASDAGAGPCARGDTLFCEDFEGAFAPSSGDAVTGGGALEVVDAPGRPGRRALRATTPAVPDGTGPVLASMVRGIGDGSARRVIVEADLYFEAVPEPEADEMGFLAVRLAEGSRPFLVTAFAENGATHITCETPDFSGGPYSPPGLPVQTWLSVELDVDFAAGSFAVRSAPSGETLTEMTRHTPGSPASLPRGLRVLAGIQRYNDATPALAVLYDHVVVRAAP